MPIGYHWSGFVRQARLPVTFVLYTSLLPGDVRLGSSSGRGADGRGGRGWKMANF